MGALAYAVRRAASCGCGGATAVRGLRGLGKYAAAEIAGTSGRKLGYVVRFANGCRPLTYQ